MNNQRRKELKKYWHRLDEMKGTLESLKEEAGSLKDDLQATRDAEEEAYNNLSENLQGGDKGQAMQEALDHMDTVLHWLESIEEIDDAADILEALDNAEHAGT